MSHASLSSNSLTFNDGTGDLIAAVYPSSPESGAAAIGSYGTLATLLDLDDVVALRDLLNTCLVQAGRQPDPQEVDSTDEAIDKQIKANEPRSYTVRLPVTLTVHADGTVEYEVDTAEAGSAVYEDRYTEHVQDLPEETLYADIRAINADHTRRNSDRAIDTLRNRLSR